MARANEQQKQQQKQKQLQQQQQQKQQQKQQQQKQQKQISETRGSSLSPDLDPGADSVYGVEARVYPPFAHTARRSLAIALAYAPVYCGRRTHRWLSRRRARAM